MGHLLMQRTATWPTCFILWCLSVQLLLLSPVYSLDQSSCNPDDYGALEGFLRGLTGGISGWTLSNTTSEVANCCAWVGLTCDAGGRVIRLDLHGRKLKGELAPSLAQLDHLQWLNLSDNNLRGAILAPLLQLHRLQRLDVSNNELSGTFPANVSLPVIEVFNISFNSFSGTHPTLHGSSQLTVFDAGYNMFTGRVDSSICESSRVIRVIRFTSNLFAGELPEGFGNCTKLEELYAELNSISGSLPDDIFKLQFLKNLSLQENQLTGRMSPRFGNLSSLAQLDISFNSFSGHLPDVFGRLGKLEYFSAQSNLLRGPLPASLSQSPSLKMLYLRNNSLNGRINLNCLKMTQLSSLDLGTNKFIGTIDSLSDCHHLRSLNLGTNNLSGEIPADFRKLQFLSYISLSNNSFTNVSSALSVLQDCPSLTSLVLTKNFHDGKAWPMTGIHGFHKIQVFAIANSHLSGAIPPWLANFRELKVLDLSWNQLSGDIPAWIGDLEFLFYVDLSNNSLTGVIPNSFSSMKGLLTFNSSQQSTETDYFPFFIKRNKTGKGLQYKQVSSFPPSLILSHNKLIGAILPGFGSLKNLYVLDLSNNNISGIIPDELSGMSSLESLDLSHNNLTGSIPYSLTKLNFLSSFSVAYNNLMGTVPLRGQFSTFTGSDYEGNPNLCGTRFGLSPCQSNHAPIISATGNRKNKGLILGIIIGIAIGAAMVLSVAVVLALKRSFRRQDHIVKAVVDTNVAFELAPASLVLLFQNEDNDKALTISDILKSTNYFDQANIIGCGGFGLVYKGTLPDGAKIAIKRLSGDFGQMEREFKAEVETLSKAKHPNLVLLQGYCRNGSDRLLIYSYMANGSLDHWLHEKPDGPSRLNWQRRLQIAKGAARGLAYLHLSCEPHILHRDIKSSNILLDENFEAQLADFGLARLICPYDTHVTTDLVGTLGYIPPEYGQSSVATFKGDVYSFGIVLLELLTGKRPVDMCKRKGARELVSWVMDMKGEHREADVLDRAMYDKKFEMQMMKMIDFACLCISESPKLRPLTHELVLWLDNICASCEATK
ncbi:phytosulfokine receptor 1 [Aegilops tauschii subsp. strangulata]|uniref:non-specific serine/threonine protein kinase n=2 Tax=Aegilops tauschii TaxID=37682 RepID=A0A453P4Q8_AEGTS|nr:phytosulfokine receptor 1 [Aegilops tauschii subsp. strangulata]